MDVPAYRVSHQLKDQKCTAVVVQFMLDGEQLVPWLMKPIDLFPKLTGHAMLICMFYFLRAWLTYNPSLIFFIINYIRLTPSPRTTVLSSTDIYRLLWN